ncbi:Wadjet anti-phage system protein JetD domain-containing protein [Arthrobacter sp. NPDC056493]|uniref:Wadjet anti-phage system protein JetD domain-containing protein n=1 Tax=Arthrobacter sp. NPDC056493 TaxID=3345839 RepID=UPI00366B46DC
MQAGPCCAPRTPAGHLVFHGSIHGAQPASVLMDEDTLLAHREAWGTEPSPSRAVLSRLTEEEAALYEALGNDAYGPSVRLEQELIRWDWALERLHPPG